MKKIKITADISQQAFKNGVSFYIQVEILNNSTRKTSCFG